MDGKLPGELQLLRRLRSPAVMAAAVAALLIPAASVLALREGLMLAVASGSVPGAVVWCGSLLSAFILATS